MSPIVSRIVIRAAARRQFSILSGLRQIKKGLEPHPHGRKPAVGRSQPGDLVQELGRVTKIAAIFLPSIGTLLCWPLAAKSIFQGHV